jgi:hypothetical protein
MTLRQHGVYMAGVIVLGFVLNVIVMVILEAL